MTNLAVIGAMISFLAWFLLGFTGFELPCEFVEVAIASIPLGLMSSLYLLNNLIKSK